MLRKYFFRPQYLRTLSVAAAKNGNFSVWSPLKYKLIWLEIHSNHAHATSQKRQLSDRQWRGQRVNLATFTIALPNQHPTTASLSRSLSDLGIRYLLWELGP